MQMDAQEIFAQFRLNQNWKIAFFPLLFLKFFLREKLSAKGTSILRYQGCPVSCFNASSMSCPSQSASYIEQPAATNSQAYSTALEKTALPSLLDQFLPRTDRERKRRYKWLHAWNRELWDCSSKSSCTKYASSTVQKQVGLE